MKLPSLFDLQVNGFGGIDYQGEELTQSDLRKSVDMLHERHMHRILLTLCTDTIDRLVAQFERIEKYRSADPLIAETIIGYHLEGPFMSPTVGYRGAHRAEIMRAPNVQEFERMQRAANGNIRLVTIAPEWEESADFIAKVTATGVVISIGHSNASEKEIDDAIRAGARMCTHLGNGIPIELHRHENVMQRLLCRDELTACFIPDGIHVPAFALKNYYRSKPAGKVVFTTDCMSAAGAPPGQYRIGHHLVEVGEDRVVRQPGQPNFAGSALALDRGVSNVREWLGIPADEAWAMCSTRVADIFGITLPQVEVPDDWTRIFKNLS